VKKILLNDIDTDFSNLLIELCESNKCELVIFNKSREIFNFSNGSLPNYRALCRYGNTVWSFNTNKKKCVPLISMILKERLKSITILEENTKKKRMLYALERVSDAMFSIYDKEKILQTILDVATEITGADFGAILMVKDEEKMKMIVASGRYRHLMKSVWLNIGDGITGWVALNGKTANIPDVKKDKRYFKALEEVSSELAVPLMSNDKVIGVINVDSMQIGKFSRDDEIILTNLGIQAAKILENALLYEKASRKVRELSIIFQINKAISTILDIEILLPKIINHIASVMHIEKASLLLLNDSNQLEIKAAIGLEEDIISNTRIALGQGISGMVAQSGHPLLIQDLENNPKYKSKFKKHFKTNSILSVPLTVHGKTIGVINVNDKKNGGNFTNDDLNLLETIAIQVASAISNARLYEKTRKNLQEFAAVNSLGYKLNSSLEHEIIINQFLKECSNIFVSESNYFAKFDTSGNNIEEIYKNNTKNNEKTEKLIFEYCNTIRCVNIVSDTRKEKSLSRYSKNSKGFSLISTPIIFKNNLLGLVVIKRNLKNSKPFNNENLRFLCTLSSQFASSLQNANLYSELIDLYLTTIQSLAAAIDAKDPYTHGHSQRVSEFSVMIAKELSCSDEETEIIKHTALLHDIGKIGIPEKILLKPGKLTDDEYHQIMKHPELGTEIIKQIKYLDKVRICLKHHHEKFDGTGYPNGISGEDIPLGARIISVADTFDAMTSDRPYRKGCTTEQALNELIKYSNSQFDPIIVNAFVKAIKKSGYDYKETHPVNEHLLKFITG